jgi:D-mannonate dehydratase
MSNWTKPVLLRRLEENDKWLDYQANQIDAFQAFRDKKENLQGQADDLLKEMEALNDAKNSLAKRRVKILEEVKKLDAVIEMTEPTF